MSFRLNLLKYLRIKYIIHLSIITCVSLGTYLLYNNYKEQIESRFNLNNFNLNNFNLNNFNLNNFNFLNTFEDLKYRKV